jgi:C1A family cysteine protease
MPHDFFNGLGWHPDLPDPRDYAPDGDIAAGLLRALKPAGALPKCVDWREYAGPVRDQGRLAAGAAHACAGLLRYFERRATGRVVDPSPMFLHDAAGRLTRAAAEGRPFRGIWRVATRFGVPEERYWPYDPAAEGREPDAFVYAVARRVEGLIYVRLDGRGARGEGALATVKAYLAAGFAGVCGFPVCTGVSAEGEIPYPTVYDRVRGGQAALVLGYDDGRRVRSCKGALLVALSWGPDWGDHGCGWLPYLYVKERLALDFWTLLAPEWLASGEFQRPG